MGIGTCPCCKRENVEIVRSHLVPGGVWDLCRGPDGDSIYITGEVVLFTTRETKDHLLCLLCEDLLNKNGEGWTIPLLATMERTFPLHDIVQRVPAAVEQRGVNIKGHLAARNPDIDRAKLAHFALGIFWKAAVHSWTNKRADTRIDLGPYEDELRLFLRGEAAFPKRMALTVTIQPKPVEIISVVFPTLSSRNQCHHFALYVPGIHFDLFTGKTIPDVVRRCCFVSGDENPMMEDDMSNVLKRRARETARHAHIQKRVQEMQERLRRGNA